MTATLVEAPGRQGVLDAAAELFVTHGYEGTTLRQIATAAGIKAGSIYHHFDSKESLFLAVLRDGMHVMAAAFDRATAGTNSARTAEAGSAGTGSAGTDTAEAGTDRAGADRAGTGSAGTDEAGSATTDTTGGADDTAVGDRLRAHVRAHLGAIFENGPYTTAHVTSFFIAPPTIRAQVIPHRDAYERQWADLFAELFPDRSAERRRLERLILFGSMNSTAEWFDPTGDVAIDQLATTIADHYLHGTSTPA